MKYKKVIGITAAFVLFISSAVGCGQKETADNAQSQSSDSAQEKTAESGGDTVELTFYHRMNTAADYIEDFVAKYNEEHPDVHITTDVQTDSAVLQARYAAGENPEIVMGPQTTQYMVEGKYVALDEAMPELVETVRPELLDVVRENTTDHIYRLPTGMGTYGLLYDRSLFEELELEVPATWEEFVETCQIIKEKKPDVYPFYIEPDNMGQQVYYLALGLSMLDNGMTAYNKAATKNDQSVLRFMEDGYLDLYAHRLMDLVDKGLIDTEIAIVGSGDTAAEGFAQHRIGMMLDGTYWYGDAVAQYPEIAEYIGFSAIPSIDGRDAYGSVDYDSCISISAASPHQEELKEFLTAWMENTADYCAVRGCPSSVKDVQVEWADEKFVEEVSYVLDNCETGVVQAESPNGFYTEQISSIIEEMLVGSLSPDDFAQRFTDEWNAAYGSN